jgi:CHAT domain-containing protein
MSHWRDDSSTTKVLMTRFLALAASSPKKVDALAIIAQRKGAATVLASLWPLANASTSAFMNEFYKRRERGKTSKAEALRETQLAFLRGEVSPADKGGARGTASVGGKGKPSTDWTLPYYWGRSFSSGIGSEGTARIRCSSTS